MSRSVLIVDDEADMRQVLQTVLKIEGYEVRSAENAGGALKLIRENEPDIILLDQMLPDMNGLDFLLKLRNMELESMVIMMSGFGDIKDAVQGMKMGAFEYLKKPFSKDEIIAVVRKTFEVKSLSREAELLKQKVEEGIPKSVPIFSESESMKEIMGQLNKVAGTDLTIVLQGESGTGKEVIARQIHLMSKRKKESFVAVDCGTFRI